jgi:Tfp pilus assembly protein PilW
MKQLRNSVFSKLRSTRGGTILEVLIAAFITGIISASAFEFYSSMHGQAEGQQRIIDMQLISRNSVAEIKKNLRMAGFKLASHDPYYVSDDSLVIYLRGSQPVDTIRYYLEEFSDADYGSMPNLPNGVAVHRLMKQVNAADPVIFSDFVTFMQVSLIDSSSATIDITSITNLPDQEWPYNNGYRTYNVSDRVKMRNL